MRFQALLAVAVAVTFLFAGAASDSRTGNYLECLQQEQCEEFREPRCCPKGFCCDKYTTEGGENVTSKCVREDDKQMSSGICKEFSLTPEQLRDPGYFIRPLRLEMVKEIDNPTLLNFVQDQFVGETDPTGIFTMLTKLNSRLPTEYHFGLFAKKRLAGRG